MTPRDVVLMALLYAAIAAVILVAGMASGRADPAPYRAVTLVCPSDLPPAACDRGTALDVLSTVSVPTPFACMMGGLNTASRASELVAEGYVKIVCEGGR